jgi:hypothetical protein
MQLLIGIDDTDNLESRGTGYCARQLAKWLAENNLVTPGGITRHQLLVDSSIPYTSHNSSACLSVETRYISNVWDACCEYLQRAAAPGSDVGLCMAQPEQISEPVLDFGRRAKLEVLMLEKAEQVASQSQIRLAGLTGTGGGMIGALAGVGLRQAGEDGRFLWLPGLRELRGIFPVAQICMEGHIDRVCTLDGMDLTPETLVDVGEWVRPVLRSGQATLYVEQKDLEWYSLSKDRIKGISD